MNDTAEKRSGIGVAFWLGVLLVSLQLIGVIHWSWFLVLAPFVGAVFVFLRGRTG